MPVGRHFRIRLRLVFVGLPHGGDLGGAERGVDVVGLDERVLIAVAEGHAGNVRLDLSGQLGLPHSSYGFGGTTFQWLITLAQFLD